MDNVLLQQFEDYLRIRGVAARASSNQNSDAAGKRKKRSVTSIADTLSSEEVLICWLQYIFVNQMDIKLSFIAE